MTELRRVTITLPDAMDKAVLQLRKEDRFARCSYSEIVRQMLALGLKARASMEANEA